jgi:methyltransferase-like protein/SAM-dependent methyltransferase
VIDDTIQQSYDTVPYPSLPYPQSHPDRLATLATLVGLHPPPVETCRVLELGCGSGGNLIPMGAALPHSHCVGVDLSPRHIAAGQAVLRAVGIGNVTLHQRNLLDLSPDFGEFDYIIAHGVYSWVPEAVQDQVLAICRHNLAPDGIAYISYNTYPGWRMFEMLRDMMRYHTWSIAEPHERVDQAITLLSFLSESIPEENRAFGDFLRVYIDFLERKMARAGEAGAAFLLHDELSDINTPVYFSQFVSHAAAHGLQYVSETDMSQVVLDGLPENTVATLRTMAGNFIEMEQYMDFLRGRTFRESLLCHQHMPLQRALNPAHLSALSFTSRARPVSDTPDIASDAVVAFHAERGGTITLGHPLSKAALVCLAEQWPQALAFDELAALAHERVHQAGGPLEEPANDNTSVLAATLLQIHLRDSRIVQMHTAPPRLATAREAYPLATPLARFQAQQSAEVTNQYHERVTLTPASRALLPFLDGQRSHADLQAVLATLVRPVAAEAEAEAITLDQLLAWLAQHALLVPVQ